MALKDIRNGLYRGELIMANVSKFCGWNWILKDPYKGFGGLDCDIGWRWVWYWSVLWEKFGHVGDSFRLGFNGKDTVTTVVF